MGRYPKSRVPRASRSQLDRLSGLNKPPGQKCAKCDEQYPCMAARCPKCGMPSSVHAAGDTVTSPEKEQ